MTKVKAFFTEEFIQVYESKVIEYGAADRTYCSLTACNAFIPPSNIRQGVAFRPACQFWTCAFCKAMAREGEECPRDPA